MSALNADSWRMIAAMSSGSIPHSSRFIPRTWLGIILSAVLYKLCIEALDATGYDGYWRPNTVDYFWRPIGQEAPAEQIAAERLPLLGAEGDVPMPRHV